VDGLRPDGVDIPRSHLVKKLRLARMASYEEANRYLDEHYLAITTGAMRASRFATDYHRRRSN